MGIDACKAGWIAVAIRPGQAPAAYHLASIADLAAAVPDAEVVGVDMPIGLPLNGRRQADVAAKVFLKARRDSVFSVPVRSALMAATHALATVESARLTGGGISQQAYALGPKILEVERWLGEPPCPVFEIHPEVSFAEMMGGPASATKKSWAGMIERRAALAQAGVTLDHITDGAARRAAVDDMLDAAAAAWTAIRLLNGSARSLPDPPEVDGSGRQVAIWI